MGPAFSETLAREDRSPNSNSRVRGGVAITTGARSFGGGSDESGLAVVGTRDPGSVLTGQTSERKEYSASEACRQRAKPVDARGAASRRLGVSSAVGSLRPALGEAWPGARNVM